MLNLKPSCLSRAPGDGKAARASAWKLRTQARLRRHSELLGAMLERSGPRSSLQNARAFDGQERTGRAYPSYDGRVMSQTAVVAPVAPLTILQEEEQLFQDSVRQFAKERLALHVRAMDEEGKFRPDLLQEMFEMGLMGINVKEQYGGQGGSFFQSVLAIEELAKVDPSASVIVDVQSTLVTNAIERWANAEQKQKYLSQLATQTVGAYALSEAQSGSDAFALTTRAVPEGDGYRLSGRKLWITNAAEAEIFLVFATIDPAAGYRGITCFLVERECRAFRSARKRTSWAFARRPPAS